MAKKQLKDREFDIDDPNLEEKLHHALRADTLFGDVRDALLDRLRNMKRPWHKMNEDEQRELVAGVESGVRHLIQAVVNIVGSEGRKTMAGTLKSVTVKDGFKATIVFSKTDPERHALIDAEGMPVLLVVAGSEQFMGGDPADIDRDQQDLDLDEAA